jgi:prephenate dehydratase
MFFVDLEGAAADPVVREALGGLRTHVQELRVLGSYTRIGEPPG